MMRLKQQIIAILTSCFISPVFAQDPSTEQRMIDHCQKRHPETMSRNVSEHEKHDTGTTGRAVQT